jgi:hypothetical protein
MGAIKRRPIFGVVKPAVLEIVTATQFMTSAGFIQREREREREVSILTTLYWFLKHDTKMATHVEAVQTPHAM